jgi:hypothetical protein
MIAVFRGLNQRNISTAITTKPFRWAFGLSSIGGPVKDKCKPGTREVWNSTNHEGTFVTFEA